MQLAAKSADEDSLLAGNTELARKQFDLITLKNWQARREQTVEDVIEETTPSKQRSIRDIV